MKVPCVPWRFQLMDGCENCGSAFPGKGCCVGVVYSRKGAEEHDSECESSSISFNPHRFKCSAFFFNLNR